MTVTSDSSGDLYIGDGTQGDQITLDNALDYSAYGVQSVTFSDGSGLTEAQLIRLATTGTSGADSLFGSPRADIFDGKGAPAGSEDYEQGNGGGDTFIYQQGYGQLEINETDYSADPDNTLQIGPGITAAQLTVTSDSSGDLNIGDGTQSDQITLDNALESSACGVQNVAFSDGSSLTAQQLVTFADTASINNQTLYGFGSNGYGDTFIYSPGSGAITISETDYTYGHIDVLQFGSGITAAQLTASVDNCGNMLIQDGTAGDSVELFGQMNPSGIYGINTLNFSDGSSLSGSQITNLILHN